MSVLRKWFERMIKQNSNIKINFANYAKYYILNKPAFYLSENLYIKYMHFISILTNNPTKISKVNINSNLKHNTLYKLSSKKEDIYCTSGFRVSRFIKGFKNSGNRSWKRYGIPDLIADGKNLTVIDIGANVGEFSQGAINNQAKMIFAYEPDPLAFYCLQKNISKNKNVRIFDLAISNSNSIKDFYSASQTADSSLIEPAKYDEIIKVKNVTLDSQITIYPKIIDLIKIEAEGFEPEIIEGAVETLKRTKFVVVDVGPERYGEKTDIAVSKQLKKQGFTIIMASENIIHAFNKRN
jgi:FkbM family methyltransferase